MLGNVGCLRFLTYSTKAPARPAFTDMKGLFPVHFSVLGADLVDGRRQVRNNHIDSRERDVCGHSEGTSLVGCAVVNEGSSGKDQKHLRFVENFGFSVMPLCMLHPERRASVGSPGLVGVPSFPMVALRR